MKIFADCAIIAEGGYKTGHSNLQVTEESHQDVQALPRPKSVLPQNHTESAHLLYLTNCLHLKITGIFSFFLCYD